MRTPSAITEEAETRRRVELAIAALPERLRVPFVLRALEGQSYDHVARITGVRAATVRTQLVQARRALRRMLGPLLDVEDGR
jgi:RNA polymerase sigma-70 factor (ECF subfamily)